MLQVYDRVLNSYSIETLVALTALIAFLFSISGILDFLRSRVLARIGGRFQDSLEPRVFSAVLSNSLRGTDERANSGLNDLEAIQRFISSPAPTAFFDLPWTPIFLVGISIFHPWLGYLALSGGCILIFLAVINQMLSAHPLSEANASGLQATFFGDQIRSESEVIHGQGMLGNAFKQWKKKRRSALTKQITATDLVGFFSTFTKTFRLFLQSAMLGLGAFLVIRGEMTPGAIIAGSVLLGRALAPVELAVSQWPAIQRAREGWHSLARLLSEIPPDAERVELPVPIAKLEVRHLSVLPPNHDHMTIKDISFSLEPGKALGVIGPSGAGKSTLAKAITNTWEPVEGKIRLDGATLDQYGPRRLGQYIGYLPQRVQLFDGTIAENIARLSLSPNDVQIVTAAKRADAHEMILRLPNGYSTQVSATGGMLSGGQIQRIGLARALYSDPIILVLDEPNSNLDNTGSTALNSAIRQMKTEGKSVIIMAHRPAAIAECDKLLLLRDGQAVDYGARDQVLSKNVVNHKSINKSVGATGIQ